MCCGGRLDYRRQRQLNGAEVFNTFQDRTRSVATHAAAPRLNMSLVLEADSFTHILRIMSTNVDGKRKVCLLFIARKQAYCVCPSCVQVPFALTAIRGLGRRFTTLACKKAGVNVHKR
jgi:hypothetical protein